MTSAIYEYISQHLPEALRRVQTGGYATAHPALTPAEKALVYHYTATGAEELNAPYTPSTARIRLNSDKD